MLMTSRSRWLAATAFVCACGAPPAVAPPASDGGPIAAAPPVAIEAGAAPDASDASPAAQQPERGPTIAIRTRTNRPVACNAAQSNTPCIYRTRAGCRLRRKNCDHIPCKEGPHEPIECAPAASGMTTGARVCLEVRPLPHGATLACYRDGTSSEVIAGPLGAAEVARVCGSADRTWSIEVSAGGAAAFEAEVDWRRGSCFVIDLAAGKLAGPCAERTTAVSYEGRL